MTTANFEETPPPETPGRGFRRPADHYSSPGPARVLPTWVSFGCGGLALAVLILIFAGSAFLSSSGFGEFLDLTLGMSLGEMRGAYAKDIPDAQKQKLETEVETMREHLRTSRVSTAKLQPFLQTLRGALGDGTVSAQEVEQLTAEAAKVNKTARRP